MHQKIVEPSLGNLIPAKTVREILGGICSMTLHRWVNDGNYNYLNFPKPIKISTRNYWRRGDIEAFISTRADIQYGNATA